MGMREEGGGAEETRQNLKSVVVILFVALGDPVFNAHLKAWED